MKGAVRRTLAAAVGLLTIGLPVATLVAAPAAHASPTTCTGNLQVTDTDNNTVVGFVSNVWNSFGEYVVTTTPSQYLSVTVAPGTEGNVLAMNPQSSSFPYVGAIQGFASNSADLGVGSFNYAYLGGTTATAPGATPQSGVANAFTNATGIPEDVESAIWTGAGNISVTPQYINSDGSMPATHLVDITGILVLTGDTSAFINTFGPASDVALSLSPTSPCPNSDLALTGVPSDITTTATSSSGAVVTYTSPTATDTGGADPSATVGCLPASGSTFPIGMTTVTCTATDANVFNSPVTATFTVTVNAATLSFSGLPSNITTTATQLGGATVTYTAPTALLAGSPDASATVSCLPASGSLFPIGTTTVTCTATDPAAANSPFSASFNVTVNAGPATQLALSPSTSTISFGQSQAYTAESEDQFGNPIANVTASTTFTINKTGTCVANACTGTPGTYTVTGHFGHPAINGTAKLTVTKAATTTTVVANPTNPTLGAPDTFTATVAPTVANPVTPTGTVSFFIDGSLAPATTVTLTGGSASFTTAGLGVGAHSVTATYSGDSNYLSSSSTTAATTTVSCTTTITGKHAGLVLGSGSTCLVAATITGSITVPKGGLLDVEDSTVSGAISSTNGAAFIRVCGSSAASITINKSTGPVVVGDTVDGCFTNIFGGSMTLIGNTGGIQVIGNVVDGTVTASGNSGAGPFPDDTTANISGNGH